MCNNKKNTGWSDFVDATKDIPAIPTLLKALTIFERDGQPKTEKFAIDLGCGAGADAVEMIKHGWKVLAIDKEENAIDATRSKVPESLGKLQMQLIQFERITHLPVATLISSNLSLPFCRPDKFMSLWRTIKQSIFIGGRFSGDFFGNRDAWASNAGMTFHTLENVKKLFDEFEIEYFYEREGNGPTATSGMKYWHSFSVIAKRV